MTLFGVNPTDGDECSLAYAAHITDAMRNVRYWVNKLSDARSSDNGFYPSIYALRLLAEAELSVSRLAIAKSEVEHWRDVFLAWFDGARKKFPKKVNPEEFRARVIDELDHLKKIGVNKQRREWEASVIRDLAMFDEFGRLKFDSN